MCIGLRRPAVDTEQLTGVLLAVRALHEVVRMRRVVVTNLVVLGRALGAIPRRIVGAAVVAAEDSEEIGVEEAVVPEAARHPQRARPMVRQRRHQRRRRVEVILRRMIPLSKVLRLGKAGRQQKVRVRVQKSIKVLSGKPRGLNPTEVVECQVHSWKSSLHYGGGAEWSVASCCKEFEKVVDIPRRTAYFFSTRWMAFSGRIDYFSFS